jgi:hypothetical protein
MLIDGVQTEFGLNIPSANGLDFLHAAFASFNQTGSVAVAAMVVVLDQEVLHWTASLV